MNKEPDSQQQKFPKGHFVRMWTGLGMAIFSGLGVPLSIVADNFAFIGIGPAIGVAFGISIGQSIENNKEKAGLIRPLTEEEQRTRRKLTITAGVLIGLGVALLLVMLFRKI